MFGTLAKVLAGCCVAAGAGAHAAPSANAPSVRHATVTIDPGHNGRNFTNPSFINHQVDAGGFRKACDTTGTATNDGRLTEAAFNFDVARRLRADLRAGGARVVLTRKDNRGVGPCIDRRAAIGNRARSNAAISIHADGAAASGRGFHVTSVSPRRARSRAAVTGSRRLARIVRDALVKAGMRPSNYIGRRGLIERDDLGGLNLSTVPKVLLEVGNMRNASDARLLKSAAFRARLARALDRAIATFVDS